MVDNSIRDKVVGEYYAAEFDTLVRNFSRGAGSVQNAEDIVQEAFQRALRYFHSFDPTKKDFKTWFGVILVNSYNHFHNQEKRGGMTAELEEWFIGDEDVSYYEKAMIDKVTAMISSKKEVEEEVLRLYFLEGLKPREIVEIVDVKLRTANSYIYQFNLELRGKMQ